MAPMSKADLEKEIHKIHDAIIRLEPFCDKVEKHEKALYNNGWGVVAQTKVLMILVPSAWAVFLIWFKSKI